ncbi:MAG: hypothetical protein SAJ12_17590 [Jaaginema sp. PMC 1079.18]|nr:hypothetical protein [Jaaginema sp. PMC 1080.18]MEC4852795.1 hypothetical protein [Jaaginema sp. PMC 1079.18]MEC4867782.1 hypothetical protein [Jaaginema sp. PMC 1078.18]
MKPIQTSLSIIALSSIVLGGFIAPSAIAQPNCSADGDYEPAATTTRTLTLREWGIAVKIPENYRSMKLENGSVMILHPDDFQMIQCVTQGGRGGHGFYSETIELVPDDLTMDLREQARWTMGDRINTQGDRIPSSDRIIPYQKGRISGYIVTAYSGYAVSFLGTIPNQSRLLQVSASCDCDVDVESVTDLLENITLLN